MLLAEPHGETPFALLLRMEQGRAFGRRHAVAVVCMALMGVGLAFWLPMFPPSIYRFFQRVFQLDSWSAIVVANGMTGLFFFTYWIGVFDVLTIYVLPLEERQLDLLLSKPLTRREYLLARMIPVLLTVSCIYVIGAAAHGLALWAAGLTYPARAFIGANAVLLAWTLCLVSLVNLLILGARESYSALLIAFVPMVASLLPGMIYMYRPDVFEGVPLLRSVGVFPLNLVWYGDFSASWGLGLAAILLMGAVALALIAGWRIEKRDVVS